jgi:hypothetical protein
MHAIQRRLAAALRPLATSVLLAIPIASAASAQTPPGDRGLEDALTPGRTIWITASVGPEQQGRVVGVSGGVLTMTTDDDVRRLRLTDIVRVRARTSDALLNGALIGAGVAVASGLLLCRATESWRVCVDDAGPMLRIGAIGAAAGIGIDALIRGRRTIYEAAPGSVRLTASPVLARRAGGLRVSMTY